jgi:hypothetical protein
LGGSAANGSGADELSRLREPDALRRSFLGRFVFGCRVDAVDHDLLFIEESLKPSGDPRLLNAVPQHSRRGNGGDGRYQRVSVVGHVAECTPALNGERVMHHGARADQLPQCGHVRAAANRLFGQLLQLTRWPVGRENR